MLSGWALFGIVATAIGLFRGVPQLLLLIRARDAHGVSLDTAATSSVVSCAWTAYGLLTEQYAVAVASGSSAAVFAAVAIAALRFGRRAREVRVAWIWAVALAAAGIGAGARGLGLLLPVSVLIANVPQLVVAIRERDLRGLSLGTWLLSAAEGTAWGSYALAAVDRPIIVHATLQLTTSSVIVVLRHLKRNRR